MKKVLVIVYVLVFVFEQTISAQKLKHFYIEPVFYCKFHHPGAKQLRPSIDHKYFILKSQKIIYMRNVLPGINIGYSIKNNDKFNLGINADGSATGFNFYCLDDASKVGSDGIYRLNYSFASLFTNFSANYKRNIFLLNSKVHAGNFCKGFLNLGINYAHRSKNSNFYDEVGSYRTSADSTRINIEVYTGSSGSISKNVAFKAYLGFDLTFGKKDIEWFSLNCGYSFSRRYAYSGNVANITIINKTSTENYRYIISGSGNGFYISLSRRIRPFINRKMNLLENDTIYYKKPNQ